MAETDPQAEQIAENAQAPQSATGDQGSATQHSIPDQIAADKYRRQMAAARSGGIGGIRMLRIRPPGTQG